MTQADDDIRERERAYNRARYQRIKETHPEKWAAQIAKKAQRRRERMADPEYAAKHRAEKAARERAKRRAARGLPEDAVFTPKTEDERRESIRLKSRIYRRRKAGLPDDPNLPIGPKRPVLTPEERRERDRARWRRRWEKQKKDRIEQERAKRAAEVEQAKARAAQKAEREAQQARQQLTLRQQEIAAARAQGFRPPPPKKMSRLQALRKWM